MSLPHPLRRLKLAITLFPLLVMGCAQAGPKMVEGMTGVVYNYSQESFPTVKLNGKTVGTVINKVKVGGVTGGGGMCCVAIPLGATSAEVTLMDVKGQPITVTATVEKWWPDLASEAIVHILPGRKVVVSISPMTWPRKDLLDARIAELGLIREVEDKPGIPRTLGPLERADGVK